MPFSLQTEFTHLIVHYQISATETIWAFFSEHPKASQISTEIVEQANRHPPTFTAPIPFQAAPPTSPPRIFLLSPLMVSLHDLMTTVVRNIFVIILGPDAIASSIDVLEPSSVSSLDSLPRLYEVRAEHFLWQPMLQSSMADDDVLLTQPLYANRATSCSLLLLHWSDAPPPAKPHTNEAVVAQDDFTMMSVIRLRF